MQPKEIFLSHCSANKTIADKVAAVLRSHELSVWYSSLHILGAQQWHDEIGAALRRCDWFVVLMSEEAVNSVWVKRELLYALQQRRYVNRITPVLVSPCDYEQLSWTLSALQIVSFVGDNEAGLRELLRVWSIQYRPYEN